MLSVQLQALLVLTHRSGPAILPSISFERLAACWASKLQILGCWWLPFYADRKNFLAPKQLELPMFWADETILCIVLTVKYTLAVGATPFECILGLDVGMITEFHFA